MLLRHHLAARDGGGGSKGLFGLLALGNLDFLLGGLVAGVDLGGAQELGDGSGVIAVLAQQAAAIDVLDGGEEAHALEMRAVTEVLGLLLKRVLVVLVGRVVIFADLGVLAALVPAAGRLRVGRRQRGNRAHGHDGNGAEGGAVGRDKPA